MIARNLGRIIATVGIASAFTACTSDKSEEIKKEETPKSIPVVEVVAPTIDRPLYPLILPGELKPFEQVDVFAKARGFVKKLYVDRGSKVTKGQLLAVLEAPEITQQFLSVQSSETKLHEDFLFSRQAYERLKKAAQKNGAVAGIELDRARAQVRSDSAAYYSAKANTGASAQLTDYLKITAPFDGTILQRNVSVGALVGESNAGPLFTVAQRENLRLTVAIPEKHAQSVNSETKATFTVSNRPGAVFNAVISRNSGVLDQASRSMLVELDVNNMDNTLNGGEYAQVNLQLQRPDSTLWVPATSVVQAQSGTFVLKATDGVVKRIPVILGMRNKDMQEIFSEVSPADKILKVASEEVEEGSKVSIK